MKRFLGLFLLLSACAQSPAPAAVATAAPSPAKDAECAQVSRLARNIMLARQTGTSMEESMAVAKDDAFIRALVVDAYAQPRYQAPANQDSAAGDFADKAMLACIKG